MLLQYVYKNPFMGCFFVAVYSKNIVLNIHIFKFPSLGFQIPDFYYKANYLPDSSVRPLYAVGTW